METTEYYSAHRLVASGEVDGRTRHYGEFYGVLDQPRDDRPVLVVWGNCQAEALRILLDSSADLPYRTVRVPPVHELNRSDIPHVERVMGMCAMLVTQPVRAGYRGLPIGTADALERMRTTAGHVRWPVIRYGGLYPFQVIVRHPANPSAVPAGVPYHDLRTVLAVSRGETGFDHWNVNVGADRIVAAAEWSVEQLAARERRDCDVGISDVLLALGAEAAHTINHPGNAVLLALATRILDGLGSAAPMDPGRELLGTIRSPLEARVIDALALDAPPRDCWDVDGNPVGEQDVHDQQIRWYRDNPEFVDAAIARYDELLDVLGLSR